MDVECRVAGVPDEPGHEHPHLPLLPALPVQVGRSWPHCLPPSPPRVGPTRPLHGDCCWGISDAR